MKEIRRYKRFDLLSMLAVLGVLVVLAFESFFIFELYSRGYAPLQRFFPAGEESAPGPEAMDESVPVG